MDDQGASSSGGLQNGDSSQIFDPPFTYTKQLTTTQYIDDAVTKPMLNNYVRVARVGGGQHGEVYLCYRLDTRFPEDDPNRRLPVAMKSVKRNNPKAERYKRLMEQSKRLPQRSQDRVPLVDKLGTTEQKIRKEIAIMKKLRHPHVVRLYEVIDDRLKDKIYMAMEYLGGGEVKWRNDRSEPVLTVAQTRRIIRDAVLGLEYLHYQGIIHRDIKPANLLWTEDRSQVKIGDFGVSHFSYAQRLAGAGKDSSEADDDDVLLIDDSDLSKRAGTPSFLAPEVIWEFSTLTTSPVSSSTSLPRANSSTTVQSLYSQPRPPITKSIDIWALGVTLYCLLFGKVPFTTHGTEFELYRIILNCDWDVDATMGADRIPTGGRQPDLSAPGGAAIHLLDRFLQKDYKERITLDEVKPLIGDTQSHSWILEDLPDPERWLRATSTTPKIKVTKEETSGAMSLVHFKWNWGARVTQRISSMFSKPRQRNSRNPETRREPRDPPGAIVSDPRMRLPRPSNRRPTVSSSHSVYHVASSPGLFPPNGKKDKGKKKEETRSLHSLQDPAIGKRQRSANFSSTTDHSSGPSSSVSTPSAERPVVQSLRTWFNKITPRGSGKSSTPQVGFAPGQAHHHHHHHRHNHHRPPRDASKTSRADPATRWSEEALRNYRSRQYSDSGLLTAARRASSWGQGDEPLEFTEVMSVTSTEVQLNDQDFVVGAGGVEPRVGYTPRPRPATSYIPSRPSDDEEAGPSNYQELNVRNIEDMGDFDDSSSIASGYGEGPEARWVSTIGDDGGESGSCNSHRSSQEQERSPHRRSSGSTRRSDPLDDEDGDLDSSDEEQEIGVTFSPRKRPYPNEADAPP